MLSKSSLPPFSSRSPLCSGFPGRSEGPLPRGWFSSGMHLALANGCGGSESASSQWARKVLNGFACFSQRFSLPVLAYSRTASLRTNLFFFSFKKNFYWSISALQCCVNFRCTACGEKGTLLHCWWEWKVIQPLWRTVRRFLKKLKLELSYDPAVPSWTYTGESRNSQRHIHPSVHSSTIYNSRHGRNLNVHQEMNGLRRCTYIQWNITQP